MIPTYRACSFLALKLYQNITTHLHISHTCNFLPAVTRGRHQGLENIPDRDRTRGWSFLQEHPDWSPAALREGAAFLPAWCLRIRLPLISVKCETPPRKQKASYCFSPLHSLLATIRKSDTTPPFSHESGFHFSLSLCSALELQWNRKNRKKKSLLGSISPSLSCMVFLGIFLVAAHTTALNFNHAEVTWNSHDSCQFSSHTSFAKTSLKQPDLPTFT